MARNFLSNVDELACAVGQDIKSIKEQQVTKDELEKKAYLTSHQDLSTYAQKWELYNDIPIKARISALENRPTGETIVNQQNGISMRYWAGTQAQYDALSTKDANTIYDIFK